MGIELGGTNYKVVLANLLEKEDCTIREFKTLHKKSGNTFI